MDTPHSVNIEQCKRITATAIDSVDAFSDKQIMLSYSGGRIAVSGNGMKITNFIKNKRSICGNGRNYFRTLYGKRIKPQRQTVQIVSAPISVA